MKPTRKPHWSNAQNKHFNVFRVCSASWQKYKLCQNVVCFNQIRS